MKKFLLLLLLSTLPAHADTFTGYVAHVSDGDTITLADRKIVRLANVDAPEISHNGVPAQPYGRQAKDLLAYLVLGQQVSVTTTGTDQYGRYVGTIFKGQTDINAYMVSTGAAWVYTQYSKDPTLPPLETKARDKSLGLWAYPNPTAPWEYRRAFKKP